MRTKFLTTGLLLLTTLTACKDNPPQTTPPAAPPANTTAQQATPPPATPPPATPPPAEPPAGTQADAAPQEHGASAAPRTQAPAENPGPWQKKALSGQELFATFQTNQGDIVVKLFSKDAPLTVANFVGLSTGEQKWTDPRSGQQKENTPLYQNVIFHRVIPEFMIQGGDPLGQGIGTPGYNFEDEFKSGRTFDKPGILAMANRGPGTNGSQFFITVSTPQHLNGRHTIFGEVVKGYEVVEKISRVETAGGNKPTKDVVLKKVAISDQQPK
ncbi:Peptidyl-prolyl cis-trans isomerase [Cystobacter fuscus DSM 2262]|uniref:Peptidyl-prolyl cis-trans isomerase n=1 Tax=Cystobacter fuscus (strain ATCC 25194 / DSM 2262 / NBRC 100088 / M29) TaxID=1242864 RepID=S9P8Z0_CYSF2|nr:peptidylprolyl isomerase [Cystobacter fuscus]EPX58727.1 Peptidyl-prolyl cis-trans isomerase [Cystobacter fuscus DSM 2262]